MSNPHSPSRSDGQFSADLVALVVVATLAVPAVVLPRVQDTPIRLVLGLPLVLFAPGYAVVSALFPARPREGGTPIGGLEARSSSDSTWLSQNAGTGFDGLERVALSVLFSVIVVAAVALVLALTPLGIAPLPMVAALAAVTASGTLVAAIRRGRLSPEERYGVAAGSWFGGLRRAAPTSIRGWVLVVVVAASLVTASVAVGYAFNQTEEDVEFAVLTQSGEDGTYVAGDYPDDVPPGEPVDLATEVEYHGDEPREYTMVVTLEYQDETTDSADEGEVGRFTSTVRPDQTWTHPHTVPGGYATDDYRLQYHLYEGSAPENVDEEEPVRTLRVSVDVDG